MDKIQIYYDGIEIEKYNQNNIIGYNTNISDLKKNNIFDYEKFIRRCLLYSNNKPISFQIYDDDDNIIENISRKIISFDQSIFVKIPVIKTDGSFNSHIIKKLHHDNIKINVTAIFTKSQLNSLQNCFNYNTPVIISIFAGRINDCGVNSSDIILYAKHLFKNYKNIKILWAACRTIYNIYEAQNQGADIITVPDVVLDKLYRSNQTLYQASLDAVHTFKNDAIKSNLFFV